jgi:radical SAM protein with 4Fe4S-binding SPASM domain
MMSESDTTLPYRKHNSFQNLRAKNGSTEKDALVRLAGVLDRSGPMADLPAFLQKSGALAMRDLFSQDEAEAQAPVFKISPHVAQEIATYDDEQLPRYLAHRYRYEMYPQLQILDEYPPYLQIEPSSICNFRCVFCYETDKDFTKKSNGYMGTMSLELFRRIIDQVAGNIEFISLASRGEPLVCPDIEAMLAYTRGKFLNLKLNTNASLLDEQKCHAILQGGVKTVVFSADAAAEPLYGQLRVGGKLDKVLANVELFQKIRALHYSDSRIITRVSGVKYCEEQNLEEMEKTWGDLVDQVAFVSYNPWENVYETPPSGIDSPCSDLWRRMFVWWDGKVNPCDVDYKSTLSMGNLQNSGIPDLWRSGGYTALRDNHSVGKRKNCEPCKRCSVV